MNWYLTKIVYRIICGKGDHPPQFEDQLRLISATDEAEALNKAYSLARGEQLSFYNHKQQLVQWMFVNVSELILISEWIDGVELYSTINEVSNAEAYIRLVNDKSASIRKEQSRQLLNLI